MLAWEAICAGILGILVSGPLVRLAAQRVRKQPVAFSVEDERRVLATVLANPASYGQIARLRPDDFTAPERSDAWTALADVIGTHVGEETHLALGGVGDDDPTLEESDLPGINFPDAAALKAVLPVSIKIEDAPVLDSGEAIVEAASHVASAGGDRRRYEAGRLQATSDPDRPLERTPIVITRSRRIIAGLLGGSAGVLCVLTAPVTGTTIGHVLFGLSMAVVAITLIVVGYIDTDTLCIDPQILWSGTALGFLLAGIAIAQIDKWAAVVLAGGFFAIMAAMLWLLSRAYSKIRGIEGLGGGDLQLLVLAVGYPTMLAAAPLAGILALLIGCVLGIAYAGILHFRDRGFGRQTPFALGPSLAIGVGAGWLVYVILHGIPHLNNVMSLAR